MKKRQKGYISTAVTPTSKEDEMPKVWKVSGKHVNADNDYPSEDEARIDIRSPFLGKTGEWQEDRDAKGNLKVTFVERTASGTQKDKTSWTIKPVEVDER